MTAAPSTAVFTASATAGMSTASAAGMFTASAANAAAPATAGVKGFVSRSSAAKCASVFIVIPIATAPAAIDVGRVVARPTTPPTAASAVTPARAVTTRRQSCHEQRCKERHFPTADKSRFHFDKMLSAWRLTDDTRIPVFKSEPLGDCAASGHLVQTLGAQRPPRVSSRRHHQDRRDRQLRIATAAANQVVALAVGFEPELSNRGWIVDQLDPYIVGVGASFQSFTR